MKDEKDKTTTNNKMEDLKTISTDLTKEEKMIVDRFVESELKELQIKSIEKQFFTLWLKDLKFKPTKSTPDAVGYDIFFDSASFDMGNARNCYRRGSGVVIEPGGRGLFPCGFRIILTPGYEAQIRARSGRALKEGLTMLNGVGTIDPDYRGIVGAILANFSDSPIIIADGDKIAQMVITKYEDHIDFKIDNDIDSFLSIAPSDRGEGGYGHTGN